MQVRQCEATVGFTGRDQGHVTSPWHCTASNRTVPYHTSRECRRHPFLSAAVNRCSSMPDAPGRLAASEEGGTLSITAGMGEYSRAETGRSVPRLVKSIHTRLLGRNQSNPWLLSGCRHACMAMGRAVN